METSEKKSCQFQGRVYANGTQIRANEHHLACRNGKWQDLDSDSAKAKPSLAYFYH